MKKRFSEAQIIGFLREAEAGVPVKQVCRQHGFSEASYYLWRSKFGGIDRLGCETPEGADRREHAAEEAAGRGCAGRRCCTNRNWPSRCQSTRSSPADAIRHWSAEGGHPIEDFAAEDHFTPLPGWAPGAKAISDDGFVSEERILHPALTMVP